MRLLLLAVVVTEKQAGGMGLVTGVVAVVVEVVVEIVEEVGVGLLVVVEVVVEELGVGLADGLSAPVMARAVLSAAESMYSMYACAARRSMLGRRDIARQSEDGWRPGVMTEQRYGRE